MSSSTAPTRRASSRLQKKGVKSQQQPADSDSDASTVAPKPTRKKQKAIKSNVGAAGANANTTVSAAEAAKQKAAWAKVRGRRGQLKLVVEMPYDILLEIFQYLPPADLLCLAKASRSLRALLLDRSTAYALWKSVRNESASSLKVMRTDLCIWPWQAFDSLNPSPPSCPDDLNLPQYANLLFTRTCHYCSSVRWLMYVWESYTVICKTCFEQHFSPTWSAESKQITRILTGGENGIPSLYYLKSEYECHRKALDRLKNDTDRENYVKKESQKLSVRYQRLREFRSWETQQAVLKNKDVEARRKNRTDAIKERLIDLGYDDVIEGLTNWRGALLLPHAKGVKPLTDREWERIKPDLIAELEKERRETKIADRMSLLRQRTALLHSVHKYYVSQNRSTTSVSPPYWEVAKIEPFRTMIYDTPSDTNLTLADFLAHVDELPKIFESWREKTTNFLLGLIPREGSGKAKKGANVKGKGKEKETVPTDTAMLDLAITLFACKRCKAILPYHQAISHSCFTLSKNIPDKNPTLEQSADPNSCWNETGAAKYHQVASTSASEIITILGKDPKTATWEELDDARQRLECMRCLTHTPAGKPRHLIMDWRNAVAHDVLRHSSEGAQASERNETTKWQVVEAKRLPAVYKREVSGDAPGKEIWRSVRCVECGLWTIDEEGQIVQDDKSRRWAYKTLVIGDTCILEHDMSMGTYPAAYPSFRYQNPYTVTL
ncbi:hypothetical protein EST38_g5336 [Candolleomyces aberdarensis]|uniref:F-box domain-containing protein n=1 Tax=Candolleomyces aberdarensis TaxID=2316362 RepID=A0A4Q2DKS5_9AGAR|nr:hypothetical protein EST38_g5336 [Candolleomyces aberdarensis]